jgi:hypothetical protein
MVSPYPVIDRRLQAIYHVHDNCQLLEPASAIVMVDRFRVAKREGPGSMDPTRPRESGDRIGDGPRGLSPIGPRLLIPGFPQWSWHQRERALVLLGSYLAALGVGVFAWGTALGLVVLFFAFATHAFSAADAIRQYAFPGFGRLVPALTTSAGLGAFCYAPALALAGAYAWPITLDERPREGYFINRWAYRDVLPSPGETVWLRPTRGVRPKVARIVAGPGQRVEWSGEQFRVDGLIVEESPFRIAGSPAGFGVTSPEGHRLVTFGADPSRGNGVPGGWEIVDQQDIRGRAWARSYPIWDRRFLR